MREGLPGGARKAVTGSELVVDLSPLRGATCLFGCDEQDLLYCFSDAATGTLVTSATDPSTTALVAKELGAGTKIERYVSKYRYLHVKTVTGSGTLVIEPVQRIR